VIKQFLNNIYSYKIYNKKSIVYMQTSMFYFKRNVVLRRM
jgi:hypothetical protein